MRFILFHLVSSHFLIGKAVWKSHFRQEKHGKTSGHPIYDKQIIGKLRGSDYFWRCPLVLMVACMKRRFPLSVISCYAIFTAHMWASEVDIQRSKSAGGSSIFSRGFEHSWRFPTSHGGTPSHPFLDGIFHCKPSSYWVITPIYGNPHRVIQQLYIHNMFTISILGPAKNTSPMAGPSTHGKNDQLLTR